MTRLLVAYIRFVLRHRAVVVVTILALCGLTAIPLSQARVSTSLAALFMDEGNAPYQEYRRNVRKFGNDNVIIIGVEGQNPLEPDNLARLERLHKAIEANPEINRVTSIINLARVVSHEDYTSVMTVKDEVRADPARAGPLVAELAADATTGGLLLSKDGRSFVVIAEFTYDESRTIERGAVVLEDILQLFRAEGFEPEHLHRAGLMATLAEVNNQSYLNIQRTFPLVMLVLLITVFVMFGHLWPVLITTLTSVITVLWTMAFAVHLDRELHILTTVIPCVILIISFSDLIHMISAYLLELGKGLDKTEAIVASAADVGGACFMTSATTFVGFLALVFVPTPVFQQFGFVVGFGVAAAFLLAVTLVPILLSVLKKPPGWTEETRRSGLVQRAFERSLDGLATFTSRYPWPIIAAFVALSVFAAVGATRITFQADMAKRLDASNRIRLDQRFFDEHFVGTATIDVRVSVDTKDGLLKADVFNPMAELEKDIEALEDVDRVSSLVDVLHQAFTAVVPPGSGTTFLPLNNAQIAQLMMLIEDRPEGSLDSLVDFNRQNTRLTAYSKVQEMQAQYALGEEIRVMAEKRFGDKAKIDVYGARHLVGSWVSMILAGQRNGLLFSVIAIMLLMMLGLRSASAGAVSVLPNIFPLLALAGYAGWAWDMTDTDTIIVAMIAIGIGVDDTIHFLSRLGIEWTRTDSVDEAVRNAFHFSGRGIIITTVIFSLGFLPFALSDYYTVHLFGTLLPACFVVALLADLLLVPAMVKVGLIRFGFRRRPPTSQDVDQAAH